MSILCLQLVLFPGNARDTNLCHSCSVYRPVADRSKEAYLRRYPYPSFNKLNFTYVKAFFISFLNIDIGPAGNGAKSAILDGFHGNNEIS